MTTYKTSSGKRVLKTYIDYKVREAKKQVLQDQLDEFGYNFCTVCKSNECIPIDCAHVLSVKECQEKGITEIAWNTNNIKPVGRRCHRIKDNSNLQFNKNSLND